MHRLLRPALGVVIVAALYAVGRAVGGELSLELSGDAIFSARDWITGFGAAGIAVYVAIVAFRTFLALPSALVLILGGLVYGGGQGALWGAVGLFLSGHLQYGLARLLGDQWVRARLGHRAGSVERHLNRSGPWFVGGMTAHPAGLLTPTNLLAGLGAMSLRPFSLAVALGAPVRAGTYAALGAVVLDWGLAASLALAVVLGGAALLPLAHPRVRALFLAPRTVDAE